MKKAILTIAAVMACALCLLSCSKKEEAKVVVSYFVAPSGSSSSSVWGNYQREMNAAIDKAVEMWDKENRLSYESEANDKAAIKACDEVYAKGGEIDFDFTLILLKYYASKVEGKATSTTLKTYEYKKTAK